MTRRFLSLLCLPLLAGCTLDANGRPAFMMHNSGPSMDQPGTCFLYVEDPKDGTYNLVSGIGNGTMRPWATRKRDLDAAALDAAWAKERRIMDVNPECLAILASDRSDPRPVSE
ncbi:hypothetical protein [Thioclava sp. GXIMD2076]|uniref:Uncharacterized protein n=1 Tax=Thioclava kandeliae TaxID=3070818 RepID=A0ABV1SIQ7_9RHOB